MQKEARDKYRVTAAKERPGVRLQQREKMPAANMATAGVMPSKNTPLRAPRERESHAVPQNMQTKPVPESSRAQCRRRG